MLLTITSSGNKSSSSSSLTVVILIFSAVRKEYSRRSQSAGEQWKGRMLDAEESLREQKENQRAVSSGTVSIKKKEFVYRYGTSIINGGLSCDFFTYCVSLIFVLFLKYCLLMSQQLPSDIICDVIHAEIKQLS